VISDAKTMCVCQCLLNATATTNVETEVTRVNSAVTNIGFIYVHFLVLYEISSLYNYKRYFRAVESFNS